MFQFASNRRAMIGFKSAATVAQLNWSFIASTMLLCLGESRIGDRIVSDRKGMKGRGDGSAPMGSDWFGLVGLLVAGA